MISSDAKGFMQDRSEPIPQLFIRPAGGLSYGRGVVQRVARRLPADRRRSCWRRIALPTLGDDVVRDE